MARARRYYLDLDPDDPEAVTPGDLLIGPQACQLVLEAWPTDTDQHPNRWTLTVRPLGRRPRTPDEWETFRAHGRPAAREVHHRPYHPTRNPRPNQRPRPYNEPVDPHPHRG